MFIICYILRSCRREQITRIPKEVTPLVDPQGKPCGIEIHLESKSIYNKIISIIRN